MDNDRELIDFTTKRKGSKHYGRVIGVCAKCGRKGQMTQLKVLPKDKDQRPFVTCTHTAILAMGCMLLVRDNCQYRLETATEE